MHKFLKKVETWLFLLQRRPIRSPSDHGLRVSAIKKRAMLSFFLLVRPTGLEPVRPADTSTSSLPVCQFQHSRTYFFPTLEFYFSLSRLSMHFIKKFGVFLIDTGRQKLHNKQSTENCIWMRDSYLPAAKQKQRRRQMVVRKAISQDIDRIM